MSMMQVTFLGTGTSTGIPQIGCTCSVCTSTDPRDSRLRTSAIVEIEGKNILIDCGPDFRQQMLRFHIKRIDAVLVTHIHYDHTGGIDDLRPFGENGTVPIYLEPSVAEGIRNRLPYCFADHRYPGVPNICLQEIGLSPFLIEGIEIVPIRVMHYKLPILGYRIGRFAYITDALTIPESEYEKMDVVKKQQALMDGVVLEESTLPEASVDADNENIQYRMETGDGCALSKGAIRVTKEGAQLKLVFHGLTDSENYLIADNLDYDSLSPRELIGNSQWKKMSEYDQNKVLDEDSRWRYWKESKEAAMTVSSNDVTKTIKIFTDKYNAYSGRHDFLCNMGYSRSGVRTMTITFANTGVYTYDKLRVVSQPVQGIEEKTVKLGEEALENVKMGTNEITGDISVSEKKALVLSVPYSKGFTAYVDGKETKLQKANTMFMALELEPGSHEIRLTYCTPYLKAGMLLSVLGLVIYVMLVFRKKK